VNFQDSMNFFTIPINKYEKNTKQKSVFSGIPGAIRAYMI